MLRSIVTWVLVAVAGVSVTTTVALVVLTARLGRSTETVAMSIESVRLAEEAEIDLLLHARATDLLLRNDIEGDLERRLAAAAKFTGPHSLQLATAKHAVKRYLDASRGPIDPKRLETLHSEAYAALMALATANINRAREIRDSATSDSELASGIGIAGGAVSTCVVITLVLWVRRRGLQPLFVLADTMSRFGRGERAARAEVVGPVEVREMSTRFNQLADAVEAQRRSQMAVLGGVAHDLREPLHALSLSLDALCADSAEQRRALEIAGRQVGRLERMIEDFLELSRAEVSELALEVQATDFRAIVDQVVEHRRGTHSFERLVWAAPPVPVRVECDAPRLERAITNLVSNALKYSPPDRAVEIELAGDGGEAVLRVRDHGVGISEQDRQALFEPFRRVGTSTSTVPGIGLGLWVSRRIVQAHGGALDVASTPGAGSTFTLRLPLAATRESDGVVVGGLAFQH